MSYNEANIPGLEGNIALGNDSETQSSSVEEAKNGFQPENANTGANAAGGALDELNTLDEPVMDTIVSNQSTRLWILSYPNRILEARSDAHMAKAEDRHEPIR